MKKVLLLFCLSISLKTFAQQTFAPPGAVWHFDWWSFYAGEIGFEVIRYQQDTIIFGKQCQKLSRTLYDFPFGGFGSSVHDTVLFPDIFIYQDGDTVFWLSDSSFVVLYNFAAQPGNEWVTERFDSAAICDTVSTIHVDTVGVDTINGVALKWMAVHTLWGSPTGSNGRIYERLGSLQHFLPPMFLFCDSSFIVDGGGYSFHCYEDSSFSLYNASINDCEYLLTVGVNENAHGSFASIIPNPGIDEVMIKSSSGKISGFSVYDNIGRKVFQINSSTGESWKYNIQNLEAGIYFFEVTTPQRTEFIRFIKR
jgi:hypothetical protein